MRRWIVVKGGCVRQRRCRKWCKGMGEPLPRRRVAGFVGRVGRRAMAAVSEPAPMKRKKKTKQRRVVVRKHPERVSGAVPMSLTETALQSCWETCQ